MQIHELNTFTGDLNSAAYLAVDNGFDTGKIAVAALTQPIKEDLENAEEELNGRIDNIIAGGDAPSEAEIIDARHGADGENYSSLGTAIREQIEPLNNATTYEPTFSENGYIKAADGTLTSHVNYKATGFIPLLGTSLKMRQPFADAAGVAFYDKTKAFISGHAKGAADGTLLADIEVPEGAVYFRTCRSLIEPFASISTLMYVGNIFDTYERLKESAFVRTGCFEADDGAGEYISHVRVYDCDKRILMSNIRNNYSGYTGVRIYEAYDDGSRNIGGFEVDIPFDSTSGVINYRCAYFGIVFKYDLSTLAYGTRFGDVGLKSLVSKACYYNDERKIRINTGALLSGYVKHSDGTENNHATFKHTGFIACKENTTISVQQTYSDAAGIAFYDEDFNYVTGYGKSGEMGTFIDIVVPATSKYFMVSVAAGSGYADAFVYAFDSDSIPTDTNPLHNLVANGGFTSLFRKIGCIGDSLASGHVAWDGGSEDMYDISWGQFLARACGSTVYNFSAGGLTTKTWFDTFANSAEFINNLCTGYIIGLNQNDYNGSMTVGSPSDINMSDYTQNANTFYGNYAKIIQRIQELQPRARIFVLTNPRIYNAPNKTYNEAIRWMADNFTNVFLCDLYNFGANLYVDSVIGDMWYGGHLTETGYYRSFLHIGSFINWVVNNNLDDFKDVQFIGTNREL